jgi:O-antigen/teichoic acid export membrane protein
MSLRRHILASWLSHAVTLLVGLWLVPVVLRTLGEGGYGVWVFVNSVAGYSGLLYLGFGPTVCRYVSTHRGRGEWERTNQVVSAVTAVYLAMGLCVTLLAVAFAAAAPWIDRWGGVPVREVQAAILILGVNVALGMVGSVFGGVLLGSRRFDLYGAVQGIVALVRLVLTMAFLQARNGLLILAVIFLEVTVLENMLTAVLAWREVPTLSLRRRYIARPVLRECFRFSAFNALRQLAGRMIHFTDTIVIGLVLGTAAIVPYYIALRLAQMIHELLEKVANVCLPAAGELHAQGAQARLQQLLTRAMGLSLLLAAGFWIGSVYFGDRLIVAWMGQSFEHTHLIFVVLVAAQVVAQPMVVVRQVLLGMGQVKVPALFDLAEAMGNLVLSLLLVRRFGIVGVAVGTLVPLLIVELGVLLPYGLRAVGLPARRLVVAVLAPQVLPLAGLLVYCEAVSRLALPPGWVTLLAITAGGGASLAAGWIAGELCRRQWCMVTTLVGSSRMNKVIA